jgi:hypothetical protein
MDENRARKYIESVHWIFAKTMPHVPHWYTLRKKAPAMEGEFVWFVEAIRRAGYKERWGKYMNTYYDLDGWKYWTMGAPIPSTILINRARLELPDGVDSHGQVDTTSSG